MGKRRKKIAIWDTDFCYMYWSRDYCGIYLGICNQTVVIYMYMSLNIIADFI